MLFRSGDDYLFVRLRGAVAAVESALTRMSADAQALGARVSRMDKAEAQQDWRASGEQQLQFFEPPAPDLCLWRLSVPQTAPVLALPQAQYIEWHGAQRWLWASASAAAPLREAARHVGGHVREAVVAAGDDASAWRMLSDEGLHLKGTDLAPFPFGYFNAGLQADLIRCIRNSAALHGVKLDVLNTVLDNEYWLTGSFALGSGQGHAEPARIQIDVRSDAPQTTIGKVVAAAVEASPAMALLRTPLVNTFALYVNGRRRAVSDVEIGRAHV